MTLEPAPSTTGQASSAAQPFFKPDAHATTLYVNPDRPDPARWMRQLFVPEEPTGTLLIPCMDKALEERVTEVKSWLQLLTGEPADAARVAGSELLFAMAYLLREDDSAAGYDWDTLLKCVSAGLARAKRVMFLTHYPCGLLRAHHARDDQPVPPAIEEMLHGSLRSLAAMFIGEGYFHLTGRVDVEVGFMHVGNATPLEQFGASVRYRFVLANSPG